MKDGQSERKPRGKSVPPHVLKKAQELKTKSGIPMGAAIEVALGVKTLTQVLTALKLQEEVAALVAAGKLNRSIGGSVVAGSLSLAKALEESRVGARKREKDYKHCHLDDYAASGDAATLALVGHRLVTGTVEASTPFEVVIRPDKEEPLTLHKHDVKLYFLAKDKKVVVKTLEWGDQSRTLAPDHLKDRNNRKDVKARTYQHAMDGGRSVTWTTAEGEQVRGKVAWYGRYEVVLSLAKGPNVVMMRHAVDTVE